MKTSELRVKDPAELQQLLDATERSLLRARLLKKQEGAVVKKAEIYRCRKLVARVMTVLGEKNRG
jgi:ribosomal protein L29